VRVLAPLSLATTVPHHASQLYARNVANFVVNMVKKGELQLDAGDEIVRDSMLTRGGEVVHPRVREALGLAPLRSRSRPDAACYNFGFGSCPKCGARQRPKHPDAGSRTSCPGPTGR